MRPRIEVWTPGDDPALARLLAAHPDFVVMGESSADALEFRAGNRRRRLFAGSSRPEVRGLIELMDNNPLVCADEASVPGPAATLGLIGLGPLVRAGILADEPAVRLSFEGDAADLCDHLALLGYSGAVLVTVEVADLDGVLASTIFAPIHTPEPLDLLDDLYDECFGRSFFVRRAEDGVWEASRVAGKPYALYRLRMTPDEPTSLLTIQVMADRDGKCGAAQRLHALNVMCGLEEDAGIGQHDPVETRTSW